MKLDEIMPQGQGLHFQHQNRMGGRCIDAFPRLLLSASISMANRDLGTPWSSERWVEDFAGHMG